MSIVRFQNKIGLGTMGLTFTARPTLKIQAFKTIKTAIDHGTDLLVSGEFYGMKPKEQNLIYLKEFFEEYPDLRSRVKISVKGAFDQIRLIPVANEKAINSSITNILKYLPYIDIFECTRVDPEVPIERSIEAIGNFVDLGKVGAIGLSEVNADSIKRASSVRPISVVEVEFSMWCRNILTNGVYDTCKDLKIPILAYAPLGMGFLAGKFQDFKDTKELKDHRAYFDRFTKKELFDHNLQLLHKLQAFASDKGISTSQLALAWILQFPNITPIPGTSDPQRLIDNLQSAEIELSKSELSELNADLDLFEVKGLRYNKKMQRYLEL